MDTVLLWGLIAIFCTALQSLGHWRYGLACGFLITTTLLAIHYDFGNDYWSYYDWFEESLSMPTPNSFAEFIEISRDPGWDLLNLIFGRFFGESGFFIMVAILSIIEGLCYFVFIKKHISQSWYWLAMALYVLNQHFFILTFSMMRQSLVMAILLFCFSQMLQKKVWTPLLIIVLLSTIHNSVLLCLPLLAIMIFPSHNQRLVGVILMTAWLTFLLSSHILEPMLQKFASITDSFARYVEVYTKDSTMSFGFGYALRLLPFLYLLYCLFTNRIEEKYILLTIIWSLSIILVPFGQIIPLFARLLFYFELAELVVIAKLCSITQSKFIRYGLIFSSLTFAIYTLYTAFYTPTSVYYEPFLNFHTISDII